MFAVKPLPNPDKFLNPILSGIRFSLIDKPILFEVTNDGLPPLNLIFIVTKDPNKKEWEFSGTLNPDNTYKAILYNPVIPGSGGLIYPFAALGTQANKDILGVMFWVDFIGSSDTYRLSYEFFSDDTSYLRGAK